MENTIWWKTNAQHSPNTISQVKHGIGSIMMWRHFWRQIWEENMLGQGFLNFLGPGTLYIG